jgi:hypothetical protein
MSNYILSYYIKKEVSTYEIKSDFTISGLHINPKIVETKSLVWERVCKRIDESAAKILTSEKNLGREGFKNLISVLVGVTPGSELKCMQVEEIPEQTPYFEVTRESSTIASLIDENGFFKTDKQ